MTIHFLKVLQCLISFLRKISGGNFDQPRLSCGQVLLYRAGLVTTAVTFVMAASRAFLPEDNFLHSFVNQSSDILYGIGAGGLGISLLLIHIYVTPIKRTLQLLWAAGVLGSLVVALKFAAPLDESLVNFVLQNHWAIWLVGPLFASLTGLVFKEGTIQ